MIVGCSTVIIDPQYLKIHPVRTLSGWSIPAVYPLQAFNACLLCLHICARHSLSIFNKVKELLSLNLGEILKFKAEIHDHH